MILILVKRYYKQLLVILALLAVVVTIYNYGYNRAYTKATEEYQVQLTARNKQIIDKLDSIEQLALHETTKNYSNHNQLVLDMNKLTQAIKNKQLTTTKNGECIPSQDFLDSYNSIILRGNQK